MIAINNEQVLEAGCSGLNTRAFDLLTLNSQYPAPAASGAMLATRICKMTKNKMLQLKLENQHLEHSKNKLSFQKVK